MKRLLRSCSLETLLTLALVATTTDAVAQTGATPPTGTQPALAPAGNAPNSAPVTAPRAAAPSAPSHGTAAPPAAAKDPGVAPSAPAPSVASGVAPSAPAPNTTSPTTSSADASPPNGALPATGASNAAAPATAPAMTTSTGPVAEAPVEPGASADSTPVTAGTPATDAVATASAGEDAATSDGPVLELAEEHATARAPTADESLTTRRASASVFSSLPNDHSTTTIGGYAQFNLTSVRRGFDGKFDTNATIRRLVLLFSHHITDTVAAYTELEWENAIACPTCSGSVEIEQAYVDWQLAGDALTLRSGLVLIPMGLINLWHEPPIFHGVDRPQFDQTIIPTTWRELGAGLTGLLNDKLEYQVYVTTTLVPDRLGPTGFMPARQLGSNSLSKAGALSGRLDYEPVLGLSLSGAVFASDAGGNGDYYNAKGERVDFTFPIWGGSATARFNRRGLEARAVGAAFFMPEAGALMNARRADGGLLFPNADRTGAVPTRMLGGMVELAYDVLRLAGSSHQLLPFVRAEFYDTQSAVPDAFRRNRALSVDEWTFGISYRPIRQLVFKSDMQLRDRRSGLDELQINAGMGYML